MSTSLEVRGDIELKRIRALVSKLADPSLLAQLSDDIGAVVESQTRRRIADEKTAPDGSKWEAWSADYAKTRHGNQSLLQGDGDLLDSIQFYVDKKAVHVGSPLLYAGVHNDGFDGAVKVPAHIRRITSAFGRALKFPVFQQVSSFARQMHVPQRQYLGLSGDNRNELLSVIGTFWGEQLP